jgi:hypothetical protein
MNKPVPSPAMPATPGREPAAARLDQGHARTGSVSLNVRYYKAMKPNRVYPLVVELPRAAAKPVAGANAPLVVKPIVGGAVVTPTEQAVELNPSGGEVTFHVTPVAKGTLPDARVEISQQGRPVDAIPLKMKARTQCMTWVLLLLTILLPSILAYYTYAQPLTGDVPRLTLPEGPQLAKQQPAGAGGGPDAPAPAPPGPAAAPDGNSRLVVRMRNGQPGEVLQYKLSDLLHKNLPSGKIDIDLFDTNMDLSSFNTSRGDYVVSDTPHDYLEYAPLWLGKTYQFLCVGANDMYPAFVLSLVLGALTIISLILHGTYRGKTSRQGMRLFDGATGNPARSGGAREGMPAVVEVAN